MVHKAAGLAKENLSIEAIIERLRPGIEHNTSFLIPSDFDYLKRGGRLAPFAANIGGLLKLLPVLHQSKDGKLLEKYGLSRNMKSAVQTVIKGLNNFGVDKDHLLCVSHAGAPSLAEDVIAFLRPAFPDTEITMHPLSPAMITQGGPRCIAIQAIIK